MPADQMAMEAWKARGRELNALYEVLTEVVQENAPGFDPVEDLRALGAQRDRFQTALKEIRDADPVDMALDPGWAARIAGAALAGDPGGPHA